MAPLREHLTALRLAASYPRQRRMQVYLLIGLLCAAGCILTTRIWPPWTAIPFAALHGWYNGKLLLEWWRGHVFSKELRRVFQEEMNLLERARAAVDNDDLWKYEVLMRRFHELEVEYTHWEDLATGVTDEDA